MCPSETLPVGRLIDANTDSNNRKELKAKLNPSAVEFVSSSSTSGGYSPRNDEDFSGPDCDTSEEGYDTVVCARPGDRMDGHSQSQVRQRQYAGWESPQGVLPPSPHLNGASAGGVPVGVDAERVDSGTSNPPGSPVSMHPALMPAYSWGMPTGYAPHHGYYPPPAGYYPPGVGDALSSGGDRAASPPAGMFPAGGSPPLAPGFISVPLHQHHHGSSPMYGPSPGSSPPGHYMYLPPHHGGGGGGGDYVSNSHPDAISQRFASMSLMSNAQGTVSGGSPTGSSTSGRGDSRASARIARSHRAGGAYNPSDFQFNVEEAESRVKGTRTTVMVRNIPNKYTQQTMIAMLEDAGLRGTFDFFYLPIDFRNRCGLGYAFVNFLSSAAAAKAFRHFHGRRWDEFNSKKVCEITYARVQGRDSLVQHFKTAKFPSEEAEYQPLVYETSQTGGVDAPEDDSENTVMAHSPLPIHAYLAAQASKARAGDLE